MNGQEKAVLSVREVAKYLGLGVSTVWRHTEIGHLPKPVKIGGATRWRRADIEAIIAPATE